MKDLAGKIMNTKVENGQVSVIWMGGAGFILKNQYLIIGLDLYLSDVCKDEGGEDFKRMFPVPVEPGDIKLDYLVISHDHGDHFDKGSLKELVNEKTGTKVIGPISVINACREMGISDSQLLKLDRNENIELNNLGIHAVIADHGELSRDAIGVIISLIDKKIYYTGDTCYRSDFSELITIRNRINLLIVPINGKYGNPDSKDASYITSLIKPDVVVPCHFWMFMGHGGDPAGFKHYCSEIAPGVKIKVLAVGEELCI